MEEKTNDTLLNPNQKEVLLPQEASSVSQPSQELPDCVKSAGESQIPDCEYSFVISNRGEHLWFMHLFHILLPYWNAKKMSDESMPARGKTLTGVPEDCIRSARTIEMASDRNYLSLLFSPFPVLPLKCPKGIWCIMILSRGVTSPCSLWLGSFLLLACSNPVVREQG